MSPYVLEDDTPPQPPESDRFVLEEEPAPTTWRERMFKSGEETLADPDATHVERFLAGVTEGMRQTPRVFRPVTPGDSDMISRVGEAAALPFTTAFNAVTRGLEEAGIISHRTTEELGKALVGSTPALMAPRPTRPLPARRVIEPLNAREAMIEKVPEVRPLPGMAPAPSAAEVPAIVSAAPPATAAPEASATPGPVRITRGRRKPQVASEAMPAIPVTPDVEAPTAGGAAPQPATVPEAPETLAYQLRAVVEGRKPAVLVPEESAELVRAHADLFGPRGLELVETEQGPILLNPKQVDPLLEAFAGQTRAERVQAAVEGGKVGEILGYGVKEKPAPGEPASLVETRGPAGEEVQTIVSPTPVPEAVMDAARRMVPAEGGAVRVTPPESAEARATEVVAERQGAAGRTPALTPDVVPGRVAGPDSTIELSPTTAPEGLGEPSAPGLGEAPLEPTRTPETAPGNRFIEEPSPGTNPPSMEPAASRPIPAEPLPQRTLNIGRGQHGAVRVIFPDRAHADLYSAVGRSRRVMRGRAGIPADWEGVAARLDVPPDRIGAVASDYRASINDSVKGLEEGATFEAPRFTEGLARTPGREPAGVTLGSLGGTLQEVGHYLPESLRSLPEKYRAVVERGIEKLMDRMPKYLREARGLGDEFVDLLHDRNATLATYVERAVELGGKLQERLTPAEKSRVDQVLRGGITVNPAIRGVVEPTRALIGELQGKLIRYGYLTPEDVKVFAEKFRTNPEYLRRLYESKLLDPPKAIVTREGSGSTSVKSPTFLGRGEQTEVRLPYNGGKPLVGRERAEFLKPHLEKGYRLLGVEGDRATLFRDIPEGVRKQMGEVRGKPGFVAAKTITEQARITANHEFLDAIRQNSRWAKPALTEGELASGEWTRLPGDQSKWGPLADHFVKKDVAQEVSEAIRLREDWEKIVGRLVGMWKYGKVILNPAAMGRNTVSSAILADFGGLHPYMVDHYIRGARDLAKGAGYVKEAKEVGLLRSGFAQQEINRLSEGIIKSQSENGVLRVLDGLHDLITAAGERTHIKPAELYGAVENFYRYNLFRFGRVELGLSPREARRYALKYAIDYEVVSPLVRTLRGRGQGQFGALLSLGGAPFATFASKAIPLTLETLAKHPVRVLKYPALIYGVGKLAQQQIGQSPEDTAAQRALGQLSAIRYALLPVRDKDGRAQYLDLGYTLPFGDLLELSDALSGGTGRRANISFLPIVNHPAFAIAELLLDREGFTGKDITSPADTLGQRIQKRINHMAKQWGPSILPPVPGVTTEGGFAYEDLRRAFAGETDWLGRTRSPVSALLANVAGLRAKGVTTAELADFRLRDIDHELNALESEATQIASRLRTAPERRDVELARIKDRMREVATEAAALFSVLPKAGIRQASAAAARPMPGRESAAAY